MQPHSAFAIDDSDVTARSPYWAGLEAQLDDLRMLTSRKRAEFVYILRTTSYIAREAIVVLAFVASPTTTPNEQTNKL